MNNEDWDDVMASDTDSQLSNDEIDEIDLQKITEMTKAIRKNNLRKCRRLLDSGVDVNMQNIEGRTFLIKAVIKCKPEIAQLFLLRAVQVNTIDRYGKNALHYALVRTRCDDNRKIFDLCKLLIEYGIDVNMGDSNGNTPLIFASKSSNGYKDICRMLLDNGANINSKNNNGYTALMWSCSERNEDISELLITRGADVNAQAINGETALNICSNIGALRTCELLLNRGVNVNEVYGNERYTPLILACTNRHFDMCRLLIARGADVNIQCRDGTSTLHIASSTQNIHIVELLLNNRADVNMKRVDGISALHIVSNANNVDIVELLLNNGADINIISNSGKTPLYFASRQSAFDVVRLLIARGANPYITDQDGRRPVDVAGTDEIYEFLDQFEEFTIVRRLIKEKKETENEQEKERIENELIETYLQVFDYASESRKRMEDWNRKVNYLQDREVADSEQLPVFYVFQGQLWLINELSGRILQVGDRNRLLETHYDNTYPPERPIHKELDIRTCYDINMAEDINMRDNTEMIDYMRRNKSIGLVYGGIVHCIESTSLRKLYDTYVDEYDITKWNLSENIVYECIEKTVSIEDPIRAKHNTPYILLRIKGVFLIPLADLDQLFDYFYIKRETRFFELVDTGRVIEYTTTLGPALSDDPELREKAGRGGYHSVGQDHCQEGTRKRVYRLVPILPPE